MTIQNSEKAQSKEETQNHESQKQQNTEAAESVEASQKRSSSNPQTPIQNQQDSKNLQIENGKTLENDSKKDANSTQAVSNKNSNLKNKYKEKGADNQQRKRNFYNPPSKVIRQLAQQSYYENFYGNQGQFYSLKQKYKTQLCKHFMEHQNCPLAQYCQFAHGPQELRQPNDSLPKNFGKIALGAVHSNYKTNPCKYWEESGECKFGESCSFYHGESEKRKLIDPLPNLPEGVTLPPMPEKQKFFNNKKQNYNRNSPQSYQNFYDFPQNNFGQQQNMMQLTSIADIVAIGGFNPNKYLTSSMPALPFSQNLMPATFNISGGLLLPSQIPQIPSTTYQKQESV